MATLLNSIYFVFKISFLPKYRVIYYDYTVKWCSLINCNWCVWKKKKKKNINLCMAGYCVNCGFNNDVMCRPL